MEYTRSEYTVTILLVLCVSRYAFPSALSVRLRNILHFQSAYQSKVQF